MLLLKLDIKKAFNSVRWDFLMDLLRHLGFSSRFRGWVSALLASTSSRVLINDVIEHPIKHDAAAIFVKPIKEDIEFLASTLANFREAADLVTNCAKSHVAAICCDGIDLDDILMSFPAIQTSFPMRYLGLPLLVRRLHRVHYHHSEDKVAGKLTPWLGRHVKSLGGIVLVKAVLTAITIYHLTSLDLPVEVIKAIDNIRRAYLWVGCDKVTGGKCKINWEMTPEQAERLRLSSLVAYQAEEKDCDAPDQPERRRVSSALADEAKKEKAGLSGTPTQAEKEA
ncbi:uncharacterized protein [Aegilops tauschii subsp. strangulata]|uniref:uncharacterized protein n=1 Tax=Aegilops tauschii subsp. strangulata TaxID=200361 RepID=UPI00098A7528|nr:uncharacterized protein LOC109748768 [Aegilops tauschii subsp. strangulata]